MIKKFMVHRDTAGNLTFTPDFAECGFKTILSPGVEQHFTIPEFGNYKKYTAIFYFSPGASVWVARNTTATIPTNVFTFCVDEGNPTTRIVYPGDILSFISSVSCEVGVTLYAL